MLSVGSCSCEYTLHLTPKGRDRYLNQGHQKIPKVSIDFTGAQFSMPQFSVWDKLTSFTSSAFLFLFSLFRRIKQFFFSIVGFVIDNPLYLLITVYLNYLAWRWALSFLYRIIRWFYRTPRPAAPRPPRRSFFSGFWGGDDPPGGPPGPPPPYSRYPRKTFEVTPETQGWRPGFWTGLASGAAAGYGAGSRRSATQTQQQQRESYTQSNPYPRESGWGTPGGGVSTSSSSGRNRSDEGSGVHTSTGFGGTKRR